ncbi:hypothetical protein FRZ67_17120 [Panacibacter ginsenosidivorans]|uniref:Uncharacterized protein n=1 Tax=Panacibacter ginsenosidivorans TaxID=1813871 RepID=A0A5B8VD20_9BACT|nr:hypothetical protein [Panacibacter ginsenosidivorans]QEC68945.1 hypothetical protein FRZ67_17120 [Panacibacter ginsenosidivorans]
MIKPLRKRHLQIWTALAVLIPIGIISAWLSIPTAAKDKLLQPASAKALPVVLLAAEKDDYTVRIRSYSDTSQLQLEWINKKTLTHPTATIYKIQTGVKDIHNGILVGRIEARGNYYFKLDSTLKPVNASTYQLLLYDFIHKQVIDTINF